MSKRIVFVLLALILIAGIGYWGYTRFAKEKTAVVEVPAEKSADSKEYLLRINISIIRKVAPEIKNEIELLLNKNSISGKKPSYDSHTSRLPYRSKIFDINASNLDQYGLNFIAYPINKVVVEDEVEIGGGQVARYVTKEKTQFDSLSYGKQEGESYYPGFGYALHVFEVKKIGGKKFKVLDLGGGRVGAPCRIYETFSDGYLVDLIYAALYTTEDVISNIEKNGEIKFNNKMQQYFIEVEKIISEIRWK